MGGNFLRAGSGFSHPAEAEPAQGSDHLFRRQAVKFGNPGRRQGNVNVFARFDQVFCPCQVVARLFGFGRADPVTSTAGNAQVGHDLGAAVFDLDCLDRTAADAFVTVHTVVFDCI